MNSKHKKIYNDIYTDPVKADIIWSDVEALFSALGAVKSVRRFLENAEVEL